MDSSLFKYDYYRYYGNYKCSFIKGLFRIMPVELLFLKAFRKAQYYRSSKRYFLQYVYWELKKRRIAARTHIQIPTATRIGKGFLLVILEGLL